MSSWPDSPSKKSQRASPLSAHLLARTLVGSQLWVPASVFPREPVPPGGGWAAVATQVDDIHKDSLDVCFVDGGSTYYFPAREVAQWVVSDEEAAAKAKAGARGKAGAKQAAAARPAAKAAKAAGRRRTLGAAAVTPEPAHNPPAKRRASVAAAHTPAREQHEVGQQQPEAAVPQPGSAAKRGRAASAKKRPTEAEPAAADPAGAREQQARQRRRSDAAPAPAPPVPEPARGTLGALVEHGKEVGLMALGSALTYSLLCALYPPVAQP